MDTEQAREALREIINTQRSKEEMLEFLDDCIAEFEKNDTAYAVSMVDRLSSLRDMVEATDSNNFRLILKGINEH